MALLGAMNGLRAGEIAVTSGITIASLFVIVRLLAGYYVRIFTRKLAEKRAARSGRRLLGS